MKKLILISFIAFFFTNTFCNAQTLFIGWGPVHSYTHQTESLINGKDAFFYGYTQKLISLEYKHNAFSGLFSLSNYPVETLMRLSSTHWIGYTGSQVTRLDFSLTYNFLYKSKHFFIKPILGAGLQVARHKADYGAFIPVWGPNYFQTENPTSQGRNNTQIVPLVGARLGVKFLRRMQFGVNMQGVLGHKSFEKLTLKYTYKDDPNTIRTAKFESNGTGLYSCFFLGINLKKMKPSNPDEDFTY